MWKKDDDWFWEGNVQQRLAIYFQNLGYDVTTADTFSKSRGIDITARRKSQEVLIEVKGYPSDKYADGDKQGRPKKTQPTLQAHHWFSDALITVIRRKSKSPNSIIAIGLPEFNRYLKLIEETKWAFEKLEIHVFFVKQSGEVYKK